MISNTAKKVQVVAHRGASGYAPETTLKAYRLALEMGVDFVEMDVHMLRDGALVAIHDPDVTRTTSGKGRISELTLAELKGLDAGSWFNRAYPKKARPEYVGLKVPTLEEVFELVSGSSAGCYVEIKDPERYPTNLESSLLSLIRKSRLEKRSRVISFSAPSIGKIKALDPSIRTGLLISRRSKDPVRAALEAPADELAIRHDLASAALVSSAHEKGLSVSVWTVDREQDLERMIRMEVDRIITNYPDRLQRIIGVGPE
jgi:glycerophosphoryl diester phosphodiesterase